MTNTPTLINWGDEIKPDLAWDWTHLGFSPVDTYWGMALIILSRDGSRRIIRGLYAAVPNKVNYPDDAILKDPSDDFQSWKGIKRHAEWVKDVPTQTVLMLQPPIGPGTVGLHQMPGRYMPNGVIGAQTRPVLDPVNPIPATSKIRDALSGIAAGWDVVWHSRYIFSNHLRQQVTGRLVDGLLANIERDIQALLTDCSPRRKHLLESEAAAPGGRSRNDMWLMHRRPLRVGARPCSQHRPARVPRPARPGRDSSGGHDDEAVAAWHDRCIHHYPTEHGRECQERTRGPLARHQPEYGRELSAAMV